MKLKNYIEFVNESVSIHKGDFKVSDNMISNGEMIKEMIPREVTGDFDCSNNLLTSLIGCPSKVGGSFYCYNNKLLSLKGSPKSLKAIFWCSNNQLTTLEGGPKSVEKSFWCNNNQLTTLEGSPETVGGEFGCNDNLLTSLEGSPKSVGEKFNCSGNTVDLDIEEYFIKTGQYKDNYDSTVDCGQQYWMDLLKYMISNNIDLEEIKSWPKDFLTPELIQSVKGISKFKL